ncbi:hypothetical protein AVEN_98071-1 [Araneus ventricosus]|uniref:Fibronectin type-III domain-containing protein n=1 Tax=Araneus ventricosus TaxID=182803 RepID=A0A4Y2WR02_ARAVE|nr:hypothetical protein AVEN_213950-1 [Araneus ventricosus]GBO39620.1 hypothetical protein AVEN_98071-1 [Araneus ventricosus]
MGMAMQEDDTITQHARAFRRMASRWPSDHFLFPKLEEHSSGKRFSSASDVETATENWLIGKDVISTKPGKDVKQVAIPPSETTWSISNLTPNTRYSIRISAVNDLGESETSNPLEVSTEEEGSDFIQITA